jgi:hypothetical protein
VVPLKSLRDKISENRTDNTLVSLLSFCCIRALDNNDDEDDDDDVVVVVVLDDEQIVIEHVDLEVFEYVESGDVSIKVIEASNTARDAYNSFPG